MLILHNLPLLLKFITKSSITKSSLAGVHNALCFMAKPINNIDGKCHTMQLKSNETCSTDF